MQISRRTAAQLVCAGAGLPVRAAEPGWTPEWDSALIAAAVARAAAAFDPAESMIRSRMGPEYRYHTNLRSTTVHPTRDSLGYAMYLFEAGNHALGSKILDRLLTLQDTDPSSKWYGLWSYYLEEPLPKMSPADWNWADFNGSYLLLIETRHGAKLTPALRVRTHEAIRHAAASVRRRNVSMGYTNIAVQGTFVTLCAAELLKDDDLLGYATDRLRRFCRFTDETGSFAEYNSPTYANVTIANVTRLLMNVRDPKSLELARRLNHRIWLHVASHWHAPSRQLAGPMSRAYSTDIGRPLWIQKALNNRIVWSPLAELKQPDRGLDGEVAMLDYRLPPELVPHFLELKSPRQHRETFLNAPAGVRPVQGTTYLAPEFTLGSVNRGDFWVQRRPVLAYWGQPAKWAQLRFLKDDYDLASALFYGVQEKGLLVGGVGFRTPGGDKHVSLDPLPPEFPASRLRLQLDLPEGLVAERQGNSVVYTLDRKVRLAFTLRGASFGGYAGRLSVEPGGLAVDLLPPDRKTVSFAGLGEAFAVFTLAMTASGEPAKEFARRVEAIPWDAAQSAWKTPEGELKLVFTRKPGPVAAQDKAFGDFCKGQPVPLVRLSEEKLEF